MCVSQTIERYLTNFQNSSFVVVIKINTTVSRCFEEKLLVCVVWPRGKSNSAIFRYTNLRLWTDSPGI